MGSWNLFWCFYNIIILNNIASIALLGALILIIPALSELPKEMKPSLGERHTPYIKFNHFRRMTTRFGFYSILYSMLSIFPYLRILNQVSGETCSSTLIADIGMVYCLWVLYIFTIFGLAALSTFYIYLRSTKNQYEGLKK